jgi:hypothetical protein
MIWMGAGEGGFGLRLVAPFIGVGDVIWVLFPNARGIELRRVSRRSDRRQRLVVDLDQLRRVLRLRQSIGDDHRDRIADVAGAIDDQRRSLRCEHRRPVGFLARHRRLGHGEPIGGVIGTRVDRFHAWCSGGRGFVDRPDLGMRMRRPQEYRVELLRQVGVVLIPASTLEQPGVFEPSHGLANTELHHDEAPGSAIVKIIIFPGSSGTGIAVEGNRGQGRFSP